MPASDLSFVVSLAQPLRRDEQERNDENPENGGRNHAAEYRRADGMTRSGPCPMRNNQRKKSKDECETRHHHRTESEGGSVDRSLVDILSEPPLLNGKCDNQNAVLGGERDQRDQPDLRIDVEAEAGERHGNERAEYCDTDGQQGRKRNVPALVKRDQKQIRKQNGEPQHDRRRSARRLLLECGTGPFETVARRQC